ncbi:MAG: response regulator, partial [Actinomadura sp.]
MSTISHQTQSHTPGGDDRVDLLLIDDDPGDVLMVEKMLAESGMDAEIRVAVDLDAARRALTRRTQCIIVDLSAPGIDRLDGLREVLAMSGPAAVVVLTGLDDAHLGVQAVAAGAEDYLV